MKKALVTGITGQDGSYLAEFLLKRGYQVYSEVCSSCHGLKQLSFRNLSQPGGPEFSIERVKEIASGYSITDGFDEYGEPIERSMLPSDRFPRPYGSKEEAKGANNGAYPPDLSLIVKALSLIHI